MLNERSPERQRNSVEMFNMEGMKINHEILSAAYT